jgi:hypothetical protein
MISYAGYRTGFPFPLRHKSANGMPFEAWDGSTLDGASPAAESGADVYGYGTSHPIGLTIGQLASLFWRTKQLVMDYDYVMYYNSGAGNVAETGSLFAPITPAESASMLVDDETNFHSGFSGYASAWINYAATRKIGSLYYPAMSFGAWGRWTAIGGGESLGNLDYPVSGITVGFMGHFLPMWASGVLQTLTPSQGPTYSGTGTIEIVGEEYWSYNGKWNTATGEPT